MQYNQTTSSAELDNSDFKSGDKLMESTTAEMTDFYDYHLLKPASSNHKDRGRYLNEDSQSNVKQKFIDVFGYEPPYQLNQYLDVTSAVQPATVFYNGTELPIANGKAFLVMQGPTTNSPNNMEQYISTLLQNDITDILIVGEPWENRRKYDDYIPRIKDTVIGTDEYKIDVYSTGIYGYGYIYNELGNAVGSKFTIERMDTDEKANGFDQPYRLKLRGPCLVDGQVVIKEKIVDVHQMKIADHKAANFTFEQMKNIAELYNDPSKKISAHCSAGLGRSGAMGLSFVLLNTHGCFEQDGSPNMEMIQSIIDPIRGLRPGIVQHDFQLHMAIRLAMQIQEFNKGLMNKENFKGNTDEIDIKIQKSTREFLDKPENIMNQIQKMEQRVNELNTLIPLMLQANNPTKGVELELNQLQERILLLQKQLQQVQQMQQMQQMQSPLIESQTITLNQISEPNLDMSQQRIQQPNKSNIAKYEDVRKYWELQQSNSTSVIASALGVSLNSMNPSPQSQQLTQPDQSKRPPERILTAEVVKSAFYSYDTKKNKNLIKWEQVLREELKNNITNNIDVSRDVSTGKKQTEVQNLARALNDNSTNDEKILRQILKVIEVSQDKHLGKSVLAKSLAELVINKVDDKNINEVISKTLFSNNDEKNSKIVEKMQKYMSNVNSAMEKQALNEQEQAQKQARKEQEQAEKEARKESAQPNQSIFKKFKNILGR